MATDQTDLSSLSRIPSRSLTEEVISSIEEAIRSGIFKPGQKLQSEPTLASQLGISRNTLREAVNILVDKGVLYRMRGIGTFISGQSEYMLQTNLEQVLSTSQLIRSKGHEPGQRRFRVNTETASDATARQLQIEVGQQVLHISRIRTVDKIPVIFSDEYVPMELLSTVAQPDEAKDMANWSIYEYLAEAGYTIDMAVTRIKSMLTDHHLSRLLEIKEGQPILRLEQIHFSKNYVKPVLYCINYHNDSMIDVEVIRKR